MLICETKLSILSGMIRERFSSARELALPEGTGKGYSFKDIEAFINASPLHVATYGSLAQEEREPIIDLPKLGELLMTRRTKAGITRPGLAKRVEVSPSYVWLVEKAVPRKDGKCTRPSRDVLERWTAFLGWDREHQEQILGMAGYEVAAARTETQSELAGLEEKVLGSRIHKLVTSPELSKHQGQILSEVDGFLQWLEFKYSNKGYKS